MKDDKKILQIILKAGAYSAKNVDVSKIHYDLHNREICEGNQCGRFGKSWMCPPYIGEINSLIKKAKSYNKGIVYNVLQEKQNEFDYKSMIDGSKKINSLILRVNKELTKETDLEFLNLGAGGCTLCEKCSIEDDKACKYPNLAVEPMEAYGISIYELLDEENIQYYYGPDRISYFAILLYKG